PRRVRPAGAAPRDAPAPRASAAADRAAPAAAALVAAAGTVPGLRGAEAPAAGAPRLAARAHPPPSPRSPVSVSAVAAGTSSIRTPTRPAALRATAPTAQSIPSGHSLAASL